MSAFQTEQEEFWAVAFGNEYITRNSNPEFVAHNTVLFARAFRRLTPITSVLEFGPNVGLNLRAIRNLRPNASLHAVEINENAAAEVRKIPGVEVEVGSILNYAPSRKYDLAMAKGAGLKL